MLLMVLPYNSYEKKWHTATDRESLIFCTENNREHIYIAIGFLNYSDTPHYAFEQIRFFFSKQIIITHLFFRYKRNFRFPVLLPYV